MKIGRYLGLGLVASLGVIPCAVFAQDAQKADLPAALQPDAAPEVSDAEAMNTLGFMVAKKMKLDIGFTDQEMDWILEGIREAASSDEVPAHYQEAMRKAESIYRGHITQLMEKQKLEAEENAKAADAFIQGIEASEGLSHTESGLYYKILEPGNAENMPSATDRVKVNYKGSLIDGKVFDESKTPVEFAVNGIVPGLSEGLRLLGEGGKARFYVPGKLGYDMQPPPGSGILPGSMLVFDVEIVGITKAPVRPVMPKMPPNFKSRPGNPPSMTPPPPPTGVVPPRPKTPPPTTPPPPLPDEAFAK